MGAETVIQLVKLERLLGWFARCMFAGRYTLGLPCHLITGDKEVCSVPEKIHHFGFCIWVYAFGGFQSLLHVV